MSYDASKLQAALLHKPAPRSRIADVIFATVLGLIGAALLVHFLSQ